MPHNDLNHALFALNFFNMDVNEWTAAERLWHNDTKVLKQGGKILELEKGKVSTLYWGWGYVCVFSQNEDQARWNLAYLVWCVQQKDTRFNNIVAANTPMEESEWRFMVLPFLTPWTGVSDPQDLLPPFYTVGHCSALQDAGLLPDTQDPHNHWDPAVRAAIVITCCSLNTVYFETRLETQNSDCQWDIQSAVKMLREPENLRSQFSPQAGSPLQIRGGSLRVCSASQRLGQLLECSTAFGLLSIAKIYSCVLVRINLRESWFVKWWNDVDLLNYVMVWTGYCFSLLC